MKGILIQINNVDGEPIGLWHTKEPEIIENPGMLVDWFRSYDDSDAHEKEGIDGFQDFVSEMGYQVERVFVEELNL